MSGMESKQDPCPICGGDHDRIRRADCPQWVRDGFGNWVEPELQPCGCPVDLPEGHQEGCNVVDAYVDMSEPRPIRVSDSVEHI